ncbi:peptidase dimerization domain-containing protein [Natrialba taiwanensis]|uniref:Amidase (Hydantoinase/carbamoylase family) protein n=1 Tax=Natrialba taiwanensis DSM 12281 TaxID=1230458 RepID=L9ZMR5_9EURY|nr:peptidase dimerization domain-containing protein [Natrialba taiwanensis]ELY86438.1 amidase (hydantoinase/carbamoylase family) protein [Natrialba taiwanensis DSM 12281]
MGSVPESGIFDGPLGVYTALKSVRAITAGNFDLERPIDVVCFTGEEGTQFSDGEVTLGVALEEIGFRGRLDASEWHSWPELYVEQSERLERAGLPIGVVTSITGTTRYHVTIEGEADHSGTTAMTDWDALAAASELVLAVEFDIREIAGTDSESAVATVGSLTIELGAVNVVPDRAELTVDIRDVDAASIERLVEAVKETLRSQRGVEMTFDRLYDSVPADGRLRYVCTLGGGGNRCHRHRRDFAPFWYRTRHDATIGRYRRGPAIRLLLRRSLSQPA